MNRRPRRTAKRGMPPISVGERAFVVLSCVVCQVAVPKLASLANTRMSPVPPLWGIGRERSTSGTVVIAETDGEPPNPSPKPRVQMNCSGSGVVPRGITVRGAWIVSPGAYDVRSNVTPSTAPLAWAMIACDLEVFAPCRAVTMDWYVRLAAGAGVRHAQVVVFVVPLRTIVAVLSSTS